MVEQPNQFRSSLGGFNREDVVRYLEFVNNKHAAQVAQLTNELEYLKGKQDTLDSNRVSELEKQLNAAQAENETLKHRIAALEHSLQEANAALARSAAPAQPAAPSESELEAYRLNRELVEGDAYFIIFQNRQTAVMAAKAGLEPCDPDAFRAFIEKKTGKEFGRNVNLLSMNLFDLLGSAKGKKRTKR